MYEKFRNIVDVILPFIRNKNIHVPLVYILIFALGQPLQSYFGLYRRFTISEAAEECALRLSLNRSKHTELTKWGR